MKYHIRRVKYKEMNKAFSLIWRTFYEFIAPDYNQEGIETFQSEFLGNDEFKELFRTGKQIMYGAYLDKKMIGVVSISIHNHVSCVFVDKAYHRKGVATALFNEIITELRKKEIKRISLNASPYALPFYRSLGFVDIDVEQELNGIKYTPMEYII